MNSHLFQGAAVLHPHPVWLACCFATASALSFSALAADGDTPLGVVTILDQRPASLPDPAGDLSRADLSVRRSQVNDTARLLVDVPGVSFYGAGGVSSLPAIRGLADDRLRIKVDGMDLTASCPNHMNPPLAYLAPSQLDSVEMYAGITPVSAGGDSIGGAIVARTARPDFAVPGAEPIRQGEWGLSAHSNQHALAGDVSVTVASDTVYVQYSAAHSQADNYRAARDFKTSRLTGREGHTLALDEVGSSAYKTRNQQLTVALRREDHLFKVQLGAQDMPYQLFPNQRMDLLNNEQDRINLSYEGQFDWGRLEARLYREDVDHFMDFGADKRYWYGSASGATGTPCPTINETCAAGMPMNTASQTHGLSVRADLTMPQQSVLRLGGELHSYRLDDWWSPSGAAMWPGTFWNMANGQRDRKALFAEWEGQLLPQWRGLAGVRYEGVTTDAGAVRGYNPLTDGMGAMASYQKRDAGLFNAQDRHRTDDNWDLTLLARHTWSDNMTVEMGYAHKVRSPNLYERYAWSTWSMAAVMNNYVGDGNGYVGDPNLQPEKAHTVSVSFDWKDRERSRALKVTPYYTRISDYIDAVRLTQNAGFNVLRFANQSARLYGVDVSGQMALWNDRAGDWSLEGVLSHVDGKNRQSGDALYNLMPLNLRLKLQQRWGRWENSLEWEAAKAKRDGSDVRNEIPTPGYALVHLRLSHEWSAYRFDVGVENLFNRFYRLPLGGAYLGQDKTMSMTGGVPWGTAVPGMGRSVYVGVRTRF